jgi:signal transduction histidine kinase
VYVRIADTGCGIPEENINRYSRRSSQQNLRDMAPGSGFQTAIRSYEKMGGRIRGEE